MRNEFITLLSHCHHKRDERFREEFSLDNLDEREENVVKGELLRDVIDELPHYTKNSAEFKSLQSYLIAMYTVTKNILTSKCRAMNHGNDLAR